MDYRRFGKSAFHIPQSAGPSTSSHPVPARPLSDIREITEPSLLGSAKQREKSSAQHVRGESGSSSSNYDPVALSPADRPSPLRPSARRPIRSPLRSEVVHDESPSIFAIPQSTVPPRSSSKKLQKRSISVPRAPAVLLPTPTAAFRCIRNAGQTQSPVREVANRLDPYLEHTRPPSKTIVKVENFNAQDILDNPIYSHPRIRMSLLVVAPLFVGGSTVEGTIRIVIDEAERTRHRKTLTLERLQIDLLGVEEVSGGRRHVFIDLGNELIDAAHPPPEEMIEGQDSLLPQERSWILKPCAQELPFMLRLPLEVGPPPFASRHARIRYVLCATLHIKDGGRPLSVRCQQDTAILSVYDPEKALISLKSPLTVTETCFIRRGHEITATAGLHRQVWIAGTNVLTDIHIVNNSHRTIKRLELQLERRVLCYKHAAAATLEMSASQARIFDKDERLIVSHAILKAGVQGWTPIAPESSLLRTCVLALPRDEATIKCNKYFEVRYFLNVIVPTSKMSNSIQLQLPIILIHMNSLDVPTNSVAQVAAAIEERRYARTGERTQTSSKSRRPSKALQGRAFNAPRMQSVERARQQEEEIKQLTQELEESPRKTPARRPRRSGSLAFRTPPSNRKGRIIEDTTADELRKQFGHARGASHGSNATTRSAGHSSALDYYLQHADDKPYARSYAGSLKPASLASSFETKRRRWLEGRLRPHWKGHRHSRSIT